MNQKRLFYRRRLNHMLTAHAGLSDAAETTLATREPKREDDMNCIKTLSLGGMLAFAAAFNTPIGAQEIKLTLADQNSATA